MIIRLPIFPPAAGKAKKCWQLRVYEYGTSIQVEPDVWIVQQRYGAGYWHFDHSKECIDDRKRRSCGATGWLYWESGATIEEARANLASYLLKTIRPRMPEEYDRSFAEGPWNSLGLYDHARAVK